MDRFKIQGVINVGMCDTILSPESTLDKYNEDLYTESEWDGLWELFDYAEYKKTVAERAEWILKELIENIDAEHAGYSKFRLTPNSVSINSPLEYNYSNDILEFEVEAAHMRGFIPFVDEKYMQGFFDGYFASRKSSDNDRMEIFEYITENYCLEDFQRMELKKR